MIIKENNSERVFNFINRVMDRTYYILFGSLPPNIYSGLKKALQLIPNTRIGDWYLFENHKNLRIYGFKEEPYLIETFFNPRIYALEFVIQSFSIDYYYFSKYNKPITFKFPYKIGPFIAKTRASKTIVEELFEETKL